MTAQCNDTQVHVRCYFVLAALIVLFVYTPLRRAQTQPTGVMYSRDASRAASGTAASAALLSISRWPSSQKRINSFHRPSA